MTSSRYGRRMGIRVELAVVEDRVSDETWQGIYEKACRVARQWTPRPLSIGSRQIGAVRVEQYVLDVESANGLDLVGDAKTLSIGERFVFPARLPRARPQRSPCRSRRASDGDVLVAVAAQEEPGRSRRARCCDLLGEKTLEHRMV